MTLIWIVVGMLGVVMTYGLFIQWTLKSASAGVERHQFQAASSRYARVALLSKFLFPGQSKRSLLFASAQGLADCAAQLGNQEKALPYWERAYEQIAQGFQFPPELLIRAKAELLRCRILNGQNEGLDSLWHEITRDMNSLTAESLSATYHYLLPTFSALNGEGHPNWSDRGLLHLHEVARETPSLTSAGWVVRCRIALGKTRLVSGDWSDAERWLGLALNDHSQPMLDELQYELCSARGILAMAVEDFQAAELARRQQLESAESMRQAGQLTDLGVEIARMQHGVALQVCGHYQEALCVLRECHAHLKKGLPEDNLTLIQSECQLVVALINCGFHEEAWRRSLAIQRWNDHLSSNEPSLLELAQIYHAICLLGLQQHRQARQQLEAAIQRMAARLGSDNRLAMEVRGMVITVMLDERNLEGLAEKVERLRHYFDTTEATSKQGQAVQLIHEAAFSIVCQQTEGVQSRLLEAIQILSEIYQPHAQDFISANYWMGKYHQLVGSHLAAVDSFEHAEKLLIKRGNPDHLYRTRNVAGLAESHQALENHQQADQFQAELKSLLERAQEIYESGVGVTSLPE